MVERPVSVPFRRQTLRSVQKLSAPAWATKLYVPDIGMIGDLSVGGRQILHGHIVEVFVSGDSGKGTKFLKGCSVEVGDSLGGGVHIEAATQFRILSGYAYGTVAGIADTVLLTGGSDEGCGSQSHCIGTHGDGLGDVRGHPEPAGDNQIDMGTGGIEEFSCSVKGIDGGNAGGVPYQFGTGSGAAASTVDGDEVRCGKEAVLQVLLYLSGGDFYSDGSTLRKFSQVIYQSF